MCSGRPGEKHQEGLHCSTPLVTHQPPHEQIFMLDLCMYLWGNAENVLVPGYKKMRRNRMRVFFLRHPWTK